MDSKSEHSYREVFTTLQQSLLAEHRLGPEHFAIDFDLASSNAFRAVFPEAIEDPCFFHFAQSLWRKLQEAGHSAAYMNEENSELREQFISLISLSHVPPDDVLFAFDLISDSCQDELGTVINHLEEYYLRGRRRARGRR